MYHYVRELRESRYPALKGLSVAGFEAQLDHIEATYRVCAGRDVVAACRGERPLPPNACWLTFDDGFLDHFTTVFPRLVARGLPASFFPPVGAVEGGAVLDTHKIHFILAAAPSPTAVVRRLLDLLDRYRSEHALPSREELWGRFAHASRFDPPEVIFVKRVLQRGLPEAARAAIAAHLFEETVGVTEAVFARELYMDTAHLRCLRRHGLEVGGHGARHLWLDSLSRAEQRAEIRTTLDFLARVEGAPPTDWTMCYPFGAYDAVTLEELRAAGCALGLTTRVGVVDDLAAPLELARLDTNDLPGGHG